jgi:hypothetical protein
VQIAIEFIKDGRRVRRAAASLEEAEQLRRQLRQEGAHDIQLRIERPKVPGAEP